MNATDPPRSGTQAAHHLITTLADAGITADRIDAAVEDVLAGRHEHPAPAPQDFYTAFDETAATYVAELRELEAG